MTESTNPRAQAAAARELAARALRLAYAVGEGAERTRLLQYAGELEEQAARLDGQVPSLDKPQDKPRVVEQQQQVQQQGPSGPANGPSGRKKPR
jgi:hypothetical protein